jgi:hypothetical protein
MKRFQLAAAILVAVSFSAWLGRAELHTDDTGILAGLIGIGGFVLAMAEPRRPWVWGLLVPAGIIAVERQVAIAAFTIAVASGAAYFGAFLRRRVS